MRRVSWIGAHQNFSGFNVTLLCSLQIVIIIYKLLDTADARSQEMQNNITNAALAQHDAIESNFIAKKRIRDSGKYTNSQIKRLAAILRIIMIKTIVNFY